jgi:hypothetical protein
MIRQTPYSDSFGTDNTMTNNTFADRLLFPVLDVYFEIV